MAPAISDEQVSYLALLVPHYLYERKRLFPTVPLRPKHHYLFHYPELIKQFGPLVKVWTLRFESKHSYFMRCIRASGNFINVTRSLAQKHQQLQCYLKKEGLFKSDTQYSDLTPASDAVNIDQRSWNAIQEKLTTVSGSLMAAASVTLCGADYKPGCYVVLGGDRYNLTFGKLLHIVVQPEHEATPQFLVRKIASKFLPDFRLYKLWLHNWRIFSW